MIESKELEWIMSNHTGTEYYYKTPFLKFTDGVKAFAENAGAYWFLTDVGLFKVNAKKKNPQEDMFSVHLIVKGGKADLLFKDAEDNICCKRHYAFTDCPDGDWLFFYFVNDNLLIWHREY